MNMVTNPNANTISGLVRVKYHKLLTILLKVVGSTNSFDLSFPNFDISSIGVRI